MVVSALACRGDSVTPSAQLPLTGTHCPDSHIAWNFKRQPVRYDSDFYQIADPDGPVPQPILPPVVHVTEARCGALYRPALLRAEGNRTEYDAVLKAEQETSARIQRECQGKSKCSMPLQCGVTYTCGDEPMEYKAGDPLAPTSATVTWEPLINCESNLAQRKADVRALVVDSIAYERPAETVCVPRYCHGKARRNLDLECITDETIEELPLRDISSSADFGRLTIDINPSLGRIATPSAIETARLGTSYKYDLDLNLGSHDASKFANARLTVWLSELYQTTSGETVETFACVMASPMPIDDHGEKGNLLRYRLDLEPSPRCRDTFKAAQQQVAGYGAKIVGGPVGSRINHTLDVEGRYAIFDGNDPAGDRQAVDSCAPNPLEFFQLVVESNGDVPKQMPDMAAYLRQRQIDGHLRKTNPGRFGGDGRSLRIEPASTNTRIGVLEADIGKAKVTLASDGREAPPSLPVDFTWFQANHGQKEPVILPAERKLQAGIYLWPTDRAGEKGSYVRLGSVNLSTAARTGTSASATVQFGPQIKRHFFDQTSPFYVSRDQHMRSFEVVACLEVAGLEGRYFANQQSIQGQGLAFGKGIDSLDYSGYRPKGGLDPGPACRYSKTPLLVEALYLSYPVDPQSDKPRSQQTAAVRTGGGKLGATQNSDTDMGCAGTPGAGCRNSSNSNLSSSGEVPKSFYASRNRQEQSPPARGQTPSSNNSLSLDGSAEVFGMQVLDLVSSETSKRVTWPQPAVALEMRLAIPLDKAAEKLRKATTGHNVEWNEGRYAGQEGLGVAIGTKIRFQLGPIPGELKIAFSMGISAAVFSTFTYFDSDLAKGLPTSFDGAYPCLDGETCSRIEVDDDDEEVRLSYKDAVDYCRQRGGRLGQLDTSTTATAYLDALEDGGGRYWTGGQQAWQFRDPQCDVAFQASCLTGAVSSYRWLSDNTQFARADGAASVVWDESPSYFFGAAKPSFTTNLPARSAVIIDASNDTPSLVAIDTEQGVVCEYPAADYDLYQSNTFGLEIGAAAGFGISLCVPGDDIGVCLGGGINVASIAFKPQFQHEYHQVFLENRLVQRAGQTGFVGPWTLTLLDGEIYAEIHFFFFSVKHTILSFSGFRVAGGTFFDTRTPFVTPGEMQ